MQYELEYGPLQIFEYENHSTFRTVIIDGEPWFVVADICRALDLKAKNGSFSHHAQDLDPDEKRLVARSIIDGAPSPLKREGVHAPIGASLLMTNESGLFSLILNSKKPEARRFKKWVTSEVLPSIWRTGSYSTDKRTPAFIRRFNANWDRIDPGYFSVISELVIRLWGRLEQVGHIMADCAADGRELRPDVSVGKLFSNWLRRKHADIADDFAYYLHWTQAGEFQARQYPNSMLALYIEFLDTVWIPDHSRDYFKTRDPKALPYLPKLLPATAKVRLVLRRPEGTRPRSTRVVIPVAVKPLHIGRPRPSGRPV